MAVLGPILPMIWMVILIVDVVSGTSGSSFAFRIIGAGIFAVVYLAASLPLRPFAGKRRVDQVMIVVLFADFAALTIAEPGVCWYFVFVAAVVGLRIEPSRSPPRLGVMTLAAAGLAMGVGVSAGEALTMALVALSIGLMLSGLANAVISNVRLRRAQEELARLAVADERLRISRDMHDLLGHSLSVIALKSELASRLVIADPARAVAELDEVQGVARASLAEVRELVSGYRMLALSEAVAGARTALEAAGISCQLRLDGVELAPAAEAVLAWTVREGATNVVRHSGARTCAIQVRSVGDEAEVEVLDDGRGDAQNASAGNGLAGLGERVARLRGRVEAGPARGGGYRLRVTIPIEGAP